MRTEPAPPEWNSLLILWFRHRIVTYWWSPKICPVPCVPSCIRVSPRDQLHRQNSYVKIIYKYTRCTLLNIYIFYMWYCLVFQLFWCLVNMMNMKWLLHSLRDIYTKYIYIVRGRWERVVLFFYHFKTQYAENNLSSWLD